METILLAVRTTDLRALHPSSRVVVPKPLGTIFHPDNKKAPEMGAFHAQNLEPTGGLEPLTRALRMRVTPSTGVHLTTMVFSFELKKQPVQGSFPSAYNPGQRFWALFRAPLFGEVRFALTKSRRIARRTKIADRTLLHSSS